MRVKASIVLALMLAFLVAPCIAASINDSITIVKDTNQNNIDSQKHIDTLSLKTQSMLEEYRRILHDSEFQNAYNHELELLIQNQQEELKALNNQINQRKNTQLRILPLMRSMAEALEKFILLDLPFHQESRAGGIVLLNQQLRSPSLSIPDKFRRLLEAFQIENDYGRTIESYRHKVQIDEQSLSVNMLRIGRLALYYQTLDGSQSGYWDTRMRNWSKLPELNNQSLRVALHVAKKQRAPQLLSLPLISPEK